jgi:hypothetical protein
MHEQYVKTFMLKQCKNIHVKIKLNRPTKINKQTIKQKKLSPTRQVPNGVAILSLHEQHRMMDLPPRNVGCLGLIIKL